MVGVAGGGFVIAWSGHPDASSYGIFGQRYALGGTPLGGEFQINTYTSSEQYVPVLAALRDDPTTGGTNEAGFAAVPAGSRYANGGYYGAGYYAVFGASDGGTFYLSQ